MDNRWQLSGSTLIQFRVEFWDRTPLKEQQTILVVISKPVRRWECSMSMMFPLRQRSGREGDCAGQPYPAGDPRTAESESSLMLRRGYSYSRASPTPGNWIWGYCLSVTNTSGKRLPDCTKKAQWRSAGGIVKPIGGGYFFALPGVKDANVISEARYCGFNVYRRIRRSCQMPDAMLARLLMPTIGAGSVADKAFTPHPAFVRRCLMRIR